jgi:uncharacterized membrane protein (DUF373 family)
MAGEPEQVGPKVRRLTKTVALFERVIVCVLIVLLMVVIIASTSELGLLLYRDLWSKRGTLLDVEEMFTLFGFFLLVLIGLELLTTLKTYIREGVVQVEVVLEVALIAIAQKIIILDAARAGSMMLVGLATMVIALAAAFWLMRAARK